MDYLRTALPCGTLLTFEDKQYLIKSEVGRGGSCIVYDAEQISADGTAQIVRIKELYPAYENIRRNDDNSLIVPLESKKRFEAYFQRSRKAFAQNQQFRTTQGLINSTIDTTELYRTNGTVYSVMRCVEGCDYGKAEDDSIKSVLTRVLALSKVLKKYHENGYLHLDVKPENVFVIPETKEHIVLFDFDSLISFDELRSGNVVFSTSDGYTAPEVLHRQIRSIGIRADFYAVGALVYNKIFGESPKSLELNSKIEYSTIRFPDNRYQPLFFKKLSSFFRKTLAISPIVRYRSDDELIQAIEQLIVLSDVTGVQLISNFSYDASTFVGRTDELLQINEALSRSHIVFLSGIGGIGKTELAKRYVKEHLNDLNRTVFCYCNDSIESAVCDSIQITECEPASGESRSDYFLRKLKVMKGMLTEQDIIIIDNFDVSSDENLDELLQCPCKFLITTREDYSQFDYQQVYVDCFEDIEDAITLFTTYDRHTYDSYQQECVKEIIELLERHTMTVELAAKYLDDSDVLPSELLESLKTSSGITAADSDIEVNQRKDGKRSTRSITAHLLALFNMSGFSDGEKELIGSLSLMGSVFVSRNLFLEKFCSFPGNRGAMNKLIKTGWVKYDPAPGRISLHQVIMDLVYNSLRPDATSCPTITMAMGDYAEQEIENSVDNSKRERLVSLFFNRITGNDNIYAMFILKAIDYSYDIDEMLDVAEVCCDDSAEGKGILRTIYMLRIFNTRNRIRKWRATGNPDGFVSIIDGVLDYAERFVYLCEESEVSRTELVNFYIAFGWLLEQIQWHNANYFDGDADNKSASRMLDYAVSLFDKAEELIVADDELPVQLKIDFLRKIRSFFIGEDFDGEETVFSHYRIDNYTDIYRGEHYLSLINAYKKVLLESNNPDEPADEYENSSVSRSYSWEGKQEMFNGNYEKAIQWLELATKNVHERDDTTVSKLAEAYLLANKKKQALSCIKKYIEDYQSDSAPSCVVLLAYARCLEQNGKTEDAREACFSVINTSAKKTMQFVLSKLSAWYLLYIMESDAKLKAEYWDKCISVFADCDLDSVKYNFFELLARFLIEYSLKTRTPAETVVYCYEFTQKNNLGTSILTDYVFENSVDAVVPEYRILLCLYLSDYFCRNERVSKDYVEKAIAFLNESDISSFDDYLLNLIYRDLSRARRECKEYSEKCDYYLIGEHETANMSVNKSLESWHLLAFESDEETALKCYDRIFKIIDSNLDNHQIQEYILSHSYSFGIYEVAEEYKSKGNFDEAVRIYAYGMRNLISFFCGSGFVPDNIEETKDNDSERYETLSGTLYDLVKFYDEPLLSFRILAEIIATVFLLEQRGDTDLVDVFENPTSDGFDKLYDKLEKALCLPGSAKYVSVIWDRYGNLFDDAPSDFQRFAKLFEDYFALNSTNDFDFKR